MSVKLYVSEGQKCVDLELAKANNLQVMSIIQGLFGFLGYEVEPVLLKGKNSVNASPQITKESENEEDGNQVDLPKITEEISKFVDNPNADQAVVEKGNPKGPAQKSRQLPYVNGEHTLTHSLGEKLGPLLGIDVKDGAVWVDGSENPLVSQENKSHMTIPVEKSLIDPAKEYPSIRYINDIPHYQTYVYCKNLQCGQRKKVFVKESQASVYCPVCNTKHARRDATKGGFPEQDEFGNYFKADRLWVENHKPHQERIKSPLK
ncbi:hypothetical protein [Brevibacillus borstelensis]|uniref:hypothetical protein n=1 Tax=Brevibacillus borstelensis TaxID=45462 RepID=UPI0030BB52D6